MQALRTRSLQFQIGWSETIPLRSFCFSKDLKELRKKAMLAFKGTLVSLGIARKTY